MRAWPLVVLFPCLVFAQTYTIEKSNSTENLRGLSAPSKQVIWASGTHGTYLRSTDGGISWRAAQVPGAEGLDFRDVEAFDEDEGYLLSAGPGEQSRIYKTSDGGKSWIMQFTNREPKGFLDCMAFWDRDHGIAVGDPVDGKFEVITTDDGGNRWKAIPRDGLPPALEGEGAFAASGSCITVQGTNQVWFVTGGKVARVFHSEDAGKNWTVVETPIVHGNDSSGIFSIAFRDTKHGTIAGGDYKESGKSGPNLAFTDDGGQSWKLDRISPQWYVSAIALDSSKRGSGVFAVGTAHTGYAKSIAEKSWKKIWDLNLNAVTFYAPGKAVAVGPKGVIVIFH
jgi:photosystem II stability/assembly factor-like uncharacterized protein